MMITIAESREINVQWSKFYPCLLIPICADPIAFLWA